MLNRRFILVQTNSVMRLLCDTRVKPSSIGEIRAWDPLPSLSEAGQGRIDIVTGFLGKVFPPVDPVHRLKRCSVR